MRDILQIPGKPTSKMEADEASCSLVEEQNNNPAKGFASPARELPYKTLFFTLAASNIFALLSAGAVFKWLTTENILGVEPPGYVPEKFTPRHSKFSRMTTNSKQIVC